MSKLRAVTTGVLDLERKKRVRENMDFKRWRPAWVQHRCQHADICTRCLLENIQTRSYVSTARFPFTSRGLLRAPSSLSAEPLRKVPQIRAPTGPRYAGPRYARRTRTLGDALRDPLRDPCLDKRRKCSTRGSLEARNQRGKSRRRLRISASQKASANSRRAIFPRGSAWASQMRHQFL